MGQAGSTEDGTHTEGLVDVKALTGSFYFDEKYDSPQAFPVATGTQRWWSQQKEKRWSNASSDGDQHHPAGDFDVKSAQHLRLDKARRRLFQSHRNSLPHSRLAPKSRHPLAQSSQTCPPDSASASEASGRRVRCTSRYPTKGRPMHSRTTGSPFVSKMLELAHEADAEDGMSDTFLMSIA